MKICNNIRFYRRLNDLSRIEFGALIGRSDKSIGAIERGDAMPGIDVVMRMSHTLKIPVEELFFYEGEEPKKRMILMHEEE